MILPVNQSYWDFSQHYQVAILPARVRAPRCRKQYRVVRDLAVRMAAGQTVLQFFCPKC